MNRMEQYLRSMELKAEAKKRTEFPFNLNAVKHLGTLSFHPHCTFLVGENGSGKSTLLEALALHFGMAAEGGTQNFHFRTFDSHSSLHDSILVIKGIKKPREKFFLRAESYYNVATEIERMDAIPANAPLVSASYGGSLHVRSHGESFFALFQHRLGGRGLYFLDEPEAALSPLRLLTLLEHIHRLVEKNSQFVIATHSPIVMAYPNAWIYQLTSQGPKRVLYEETEHYAITRRFLQDPDGHVEHLRIDPAPESQEDVE